MNIQINTLKLLNRLWLNNLIIVLLLASQFIVLEHSTEHFFHVHSDYCLTFQVADASPAFVSPEVEFQLPESSFEAILIAHDNSIVVPFRKYFSTRAPPSII